MRAEIAVAPPPFDITTPSDRFLVRLEAEAAGAYPGRVRSAVEVAAVYRVPGRLVAAVEAEYRVRGLEVGVVAAGSRGLSAGCYPFWDPSSDPSSLANPHG